MDFTEKVLCSAENLHIIRRTLPSKAMASAPLKANQGKELFSSSQFAFLLPSCQNYWASKVMGVRGFAFSYLHFHLKHLIKLNTN